MRGKTELIVDEFTNLPISRQRKWQLRHPEQQKEINKKLFKSLNYKIKHREYARKRNGSVKRNFGCKSYKDEAKLKEFLKFLGNG